MRDQLTADERRARRFRVGLVVVVLGAVILMITIGLTASNTADVQQDLDETVAREQRISDDYGDLAARVLALCAAGGPDVSLDRAGICPLAQAAVADPEVTTVTLTREEVTAIAQAAVAAQASLLDPAAIQAQVLAAVRADPSLRGLDEATVRAIVDSALAAQPDPVDGEDGEDGADGAPGSSFEGFQRDPDTGQCFAVIRTVDAAGNASTARQPAGDAACSPPADPDPTDPPPPTTTAPPPPTTTTLPEPTGPGNGSAEPPPLFGG